MRRRSARQQRRGFTLVEIMMVVMILGFVLAIAVPNILKAREVSRVRACQKMLKSIYDAKEQWAMDNRAAPTDTPAANDLYGADKYLKQTPACPSSGTYTIASMDTPPTCSRPTSEGHVLP